MEISCKSEYALLALLELASHHASGEPLQIRQIASQQGIPDRYLEQLLAILRRCSLVRSQRGAKGGYVLARDPWQITLFEVVTCIEGGNSRRCESQANSETPERIVVAEIWQEALGSAHEVLQRYTLQDLAEQRDRQQQLNLMYYI